MPAEQISEGKQNPSGGRLNVWLWVVQVVLALLFLFAGGVKLAIPIAAMAKQTGLPGWFLRFVAVDEVLGALGLLLPGLLRVQTGLTPLAASGLVIIMIGATYISAAKESIPSALFPLIAGVLAAFVAYARWRLAPLRERAQRSVERIPAN